VPWSLFRLKIRIGLSLARKIGKLPWNAFSDENRLILSDFVEEYQTPEQYVRSHIDLLKNAS
jgi:hypothetical protein